MGALQLSSVRGSEVPVDGMLRSANPATQSTHFLRDRLRPMDGQGSATPQHLISTDRLPGAYDPNHLMTKAAAIESPASAVTCDVDSAASAKKSPSDRVRLESQAASPKQADRPAPGSCDDRGAFDDVNLENAGTLLNPPGTAVRNANEESESLSDGSSIGIYAPGISCEVDKSEEPFRELPVQDNNVDQEPAVEGSVPAEISEITSSVDAEFVGVADLSGIPKPVVPPPTVSPASAFSYSSILKKPSSIVAQKTQLPLAAGVASNVPESVSAAATSGPVPKSRLRASSDGGAELKALFQRVVDTMDHLDPKQSSVQQVPVFKITSSTVMNNAIIEVDVQKSVAVPSETDEVSDSVKVAQSLSKSRLRKLVMAVAQSEQKESVIARAKVCSKEELVQIYAEMNELSDDETIQTESGLSQPDLIIKKKKKRRKSKAPAASVTSQHSNMIDQPMEIPQSSVELEPVTQLETVSFVQQARPRRSKTQKNKPSKKPAVADYASLTVAKPTRDVVDASPRPQLSWPVCTKVLAVACIVLSGVAITVYRSL